MSTELEASLARLNALMDIFTEDVFTDPDFSRKRKGLDEFTDYVFCVQHGIGDYDKDSEL